LLHLILLSLLEAAEIYSLKAQLEWDKVMTILLKSTVVLKINKQKPPPSEYEIHGWAPQPSCCIATFYY